MKNIEDLLKTLDVLFCGTIKQYEGEYRWGHTIGEIDIYIKHYIGSCYVLGIREDRKDDQGYKIYGQLDLLDFIWSVGYNKGSKDIKYGYGNDPLSRYEWQEIKKMGFTLEEARLMWGEPPSDFSDENFTKE